MKVRISKIRKWFWWLLSFWFVIALIMPLFVYLVVGFVMPVFMGIVLDNDSETASIITSILLAAYSLFFIIFLCVTWHCPGCKRLTLMTASYCLHCGTRLNPDDTTDVV